jgi:DNA-binding PadR family transcriptional regulator
MPFPDVSHLQFFLLEELMGGEQNGRHLREKLAGEGHKKSAPAFYQLMARMEDAKLVKGRYEAKVVEGQTIKERVYKITGEGTQAVENAWQFYSARHVSAVGLGVQGA